jgi:ketopantoate reductase
MGLLLPLLLAASIDGEAALRHASALAALGPHPWGSPRGHAAAQYVAAELRAAGLDEVETVAFERHGVRGTNVIATLRAPGDDFVVRGAHHDTAPGAPGAYDDGGGVGVLIELARVLAADGRRARTVVFASFDGEEASATGKGTTAGSRAYIERLGPRARSMVAAFAIEMCGWERGTPVVHPIAYADPREKGRTVIAPAWLVSAALDGAREAGSPLGVGDPFLSWLYQPAVRAFRVRLYGDDLSFLQSGHPALFASDSSFSAFYPDYHEPSDTADKLDAAALSRMGRSALGVVRALERLPRGEAEAPHWFSAFGRVIGGCVRQTSTRTADHRAVTMGGGRIVVGAWPSGDLDEATELADALRRAGYDVGLSRRIAEDKWLKLCVNLMSAPNALIRRDDHATRAFVEVKARLLEEARAVLLAAGIRASSCDGRDRSLEQEIVHQRESLALGTSARRLPVYNQVWAALRHGGPVEADRHHRRVLELAAAHAIVAPQNARVLAALERAVREGLGPESVAAADLLV